MEEEIRREKYRILRRKLLSIKSDYQEFNRLFNDMYSTVKKGLFIDGKVYLEDELKNTSRNINRAYEDLNSVLNSVNRNC